MQKSKKKFPGQGEHLENGLPPNCGVPSVAQPPALSSEGPKTVSKEHSWPWHVGIYYSGFGPYPFCGGTLISPTWVVTAAHCILMALQCTNVTLDQPISFEKVTHETMAVLVGAHNFERKDGPGYNVRVKQVIIHPEFPVSGRKKGFDIALLKLERDVQRSRYAVFACLPQPQDKFDTGHTCHVAGWGLIPNPSGKPSQKQPEKLMEKPAKIAKMKECESVFNSVSRRDHICTRQEHGVHKDGAPLRPIVLLKGTPTYGLAKWLFRRLKFLTDESDTTVSSSAQFLEKLKGLLKLCFRTYFTFDGTIYEQVKGTPMGSPILGFIAEAVLQQLESLVFQHHRPKFWARYVDDTFVVIERDEVMTFQEHLNAVFPDIQFTMEEEENNQLTFLDVLL
ncbi:hypothetical protein SprV_0200988300 [Sparganum proliferum]